MTIMTIKWHTNSKVLQWDWANLEQVPSVANYAANNQSQPLSSHQLPRMPETQLTWWSSGILQMSQSSERMHSGQCTANVREKLCYQCFHKNRCIAVIVDQYSCTEDLKLTITKKHILGMLKVVHMSKLLNVHTLKVLVLTCVFFCENINCIIFF